MDPWEWVLSLDSFEWGSLANIVLMVIAVGGAILGGIRLLKKKPVTDQTSPADEPPPKPHQRFFVPFARNSQLRHAREAVAEIGRKLDEKGAAVVSQKAVISGPGGLGKTAMALEYAYQNADEYPGGVYWLQAEAGLGQAVFELAARMKIDGFDCGIRDDQGEKEALQCFQNHINREEKNLVILDNLEDRQQAGVISPRQSHLLITTRIPDLPMEPILLSRPPQDQAEDIFLAYAKIEEKDRAPETMEAAGNICERVGNLPLALEILGRLAAREGIVRLSQRLDGFLDRQAETDLRGETSIRTVLGLTDGRYGGFWINRLVRKTVPYLAYLAPDDISSDILALAMKKKKAKAQKALEALRSYSVVERKTEGGFSIHRLTQEAARVEDKGDEAGEKTAGVFTAIVENVLEEGKYKEGYFLIPHLGHLAGLAREDTPLDHFPSASLVSTWLYLFWKTGIYSISEEFERSILNRVGHEKGQEHQDYATRLNNLAMIVNEQGRYEEAEELYQQVMDLLKPTRGENHPHFASLLNNLAGVVEEQGRYQEAEELYKQALEVDEKTIGKEHPDYANHLNNLAGVVRAQGRYEEAEGLYRQALKIDERTIGKDHPDYAIDLNNLGMLVEDQGRLDEAEELYRQAIDIYLDRLGPDHPLTKTTQFNLDDLLRKMK